MKVSAKSARLRFTQCGPLCIEHNGCRGNCCDAPSRPTGSLITIHPSEQGRIEARGGRVEAGLLLPSPGRRGCPFKLRGLCGLHGTPDKPFGCVASPFTLNSSGTLIIRNRYRLLPCFRGPGPKAPAYRAYYSSLELIFGAEGARRLAAHLDEGGGDLLMPIAAEIYAKLVEGDELKRAAKQAV